MYENCFASFPTGQVLTLWDCSWGRLPSRIVGIGRVGNQTGPLSVHCDLVYTEATSSSNSTFHPSIRSKKPPIHTTISPLVKRVQTYLSHNDVIDSYHTCKFCFSSEAGSDEAAAGLFNDIYS